jgi:hypothetical protein
MEEELPGDPVDIPEDALVIRFRPTAPEDVWRWAEKEYRRIGRYRLSVYADVKRARETDDDLRQRLFRYPSYVSTRSRTRSTLYVRRLGSCLCEVSRSGRTETTIRRRTNTTL